MKSKVIRNQEAYSALGKYEKWFYDNSDRFSYLLPTLPFISFGFFCLSFMWHWWTFPLFLLIGFLFATFLLHNYSEIDETKYYCDVCDEKELTSIGLSADYMELFSVYECPCCKKRFEF